MADSSPFDLSGETVLITGGGTGLGRGFARTLAGAGARVILCARRLEKLEEAAAMIRNAGGEAHCLSLDVTNSESISVSLAQAAKIAPISTLVNNAGTGSDRLLQDSSEDEWDGVVDTNLKGSWLVAREVVRQMIARGTGGSIVNIASVLGSSVQIGTGPYAAAKAGLIHLTRAMALEWARHGIRVNAIAPGYYHTEMAASYLDSEYGQKLTRRIPMRRLGRSEDLDGAILLLASRASAYMTGTVVTVDGGLSLSII
jgi:NAD(P)-dependent dehydrogenase (short-subunit alcohol dehydrogenase family)